MRAYLPIVALVVLFAPVANATYSVVALDSETRELGVAVASCVGAEFDLSNVALLDEKWGATLAQSYFYAGGRDELMAQLKNGASPDAAVRAVANGDFDPIGTSRGYSFRQYAVVDWSSSSAGFTGTDNLPAAADREVRSGKAHGRVQGNSLTSLAVLDALERGFASSDHSLKARLILALSEVEASQGGDSRCSPLAADAYYLRVVGAGALESRLVSTSRTEIRDWFDKLKKDFVPAKKPDGTSDVAEKAGCSWSPSSRRDTSGDLLVSAALALLLGAVLFSKKGLR